PRTEPEMEPPRVAGRRSKLSCTISVEPSLHYRSGFFDTYRTNISMGRLEYSSPCEGNIQNVRGTKSSIPSCRPEGHFPSEAKKAVRCFGSSNCDRRQPRNTAESLGDARRSVSINSNSA